MKKQHPTFRGASVSRFTGARQRSITRFFSALQQHIPQSNFIETNWASDFGGDRRHTVTHLSEIRRQGVDAPVDILDRDETKADYVMLPVKGGNELFSRRVVAHVP